MTRSYYSSDIEAFVNEEANSILGIMTRNHGFHLEDLQRDAWVYQIKFLKESLLGIRGKIYFEYSIPRMGKRADVLIVSGGLVIIIEFKVGASCFHQQDIDQVIDYSLDLKNFHEESHDLYVLPILISTSTIYTSQNTLNKSIDKLFSVVCTDGTDLKKLIEEYGSLVGGCEINISKWENSRYKPTPTIIEATLALYNEHDVSEISRSDSGATNLSVTSNTISEIIQRSLCEKEKSIVLVTGVPGAGKTLVGLNIATKYINKNDDLYSVFLSGNGPLVKILQEALARDKSSRSNIKIGTARSEVKAFIQNVHHFRDDGLSNMKKPPIEHVVLFDEAQRAWNKDQTVDFMRRKKGQSEFSQSEPEFLLSCMDRHAEWAVVVCLIGGGQEINKGEAGVSGWVDAVINSFPHWKIYSSDKITSNEYGGEETLEKIRHHRTNKFKSELHLKSSIRSFRSENVSSFVKQLLDLEPNKATESLRNMSDNYPVYLTRNIDTARKWLKEKARGTERYGIVVSSQAERLRPLGIHVKAPLDPVKWFLEDKSHVKSSFYLEDTATEFHVQGLELDWVGVAWDADFRYTNDGWDHWSFRGKRWQKIHKEDRRLYQKNAYRVLLTRARQGMIIIVPEGDDEDPTRPKDYYDGTFRYLANMGLNII